MNALRTTVQVSPMLYPDSGRFTEKCSQCCPSLSCHATSIGHPPYTSIYVPQRAQRWVLSTRWLLLAQPGRSLCKANPCSHLPIVSNRIDLTSDAMTRGMPSYLILPGDRCLASNCNLFSIFLISICHETFVRHSQLSHHYHKS
jgi:hypothetical protein